MSRALVRAVLVEDEDAVARSIARLLAAHGVELTHLSTGEQIEALLASAGRDEAYDVILLDVNLPDHNGLEILQCLRGRGSDTSVIMLTGDATEATATAALRAGAYHYMVKADLDDHFIDVVRAASAHTALTRQLSVPKRGDATALETEIVGRSAAASDLRHQIRQIAGSSVNVLVTGESGTGKEIAARAIHRLSPRADRPFVPLNCGSIPEGLIDSELFGHVRGSFTGATANRAGVFVEADGGTLFLDEIGDMPLALQAKLLRALQEGEIEPLGSNKLIPFDARVIAATSRDLVKLVREGNFREDLYYRLNVLPIRVPPLRERSEDLAALVEALGEDMALRSGEQPPELSPEALAMLARQTWRGNIRELRNVLEQAAMRADSHFLGREQIEAVLRETAGARIGPADDAFRLALKPAGASGAPVSPNLLRPLDEQVAELERAAIAAAMDRCGGNKVAVARLLGISRAKLYERLRPADEAGA